MDTRSWDNPFSVAAMLLLLVAAPAGAAPPESITIRGQLVDDQGYALAGPRVYAIRFYDAATGGNQLGAKITGATTLSAEGLFSVSVTPAQAVLDSAAAWYAIAVDSDDPPDGVDAGDWFADRVKVESVPFALEAGEARHVDAANVGGGGVDDTELGHLDGVSGNIQAQLDTKADDGNLTTHVGDTANPHGVTAAQVGLGNVNNTSDADKPVSTATQAALDDKLAKTSEAYVVVEVSSKPETNGANLLSAYAAARALKPFGSALSTTNRAVVLVPPGQYDLESDQLTLDTEYVDLVGVSTTREDQHIHGTSDGLGTGVLAQSANDVHIENLSVECTRSSGSQTSDATNPAAYFPETALDLTVVRNCHFMPSSVSRSMRTSIEYAGTYENCRAYDQSFGGRTGGLASGTFVHCTSGNHAFGANGGEASGTFIHCTGGDYAFGGNTGEASGTFIHCTGGNYAFGGNLGEASGTFTHCTGGDSTFGGNLGEASGTFTHCTGGDVAFGGNGGTASGAFVGCTGGVEAFGGDGTASGTFTNCTGGLRAFGSGGDTTGGEFHGCRMTGGTWTGPFKGRMENCRWGVGFTCAADARIYRSTILGTVDLGNTAAGIAHSAVKGTIQNAGSAAFNTGNLEDTDVN